MKRARFTGLGWLGVSLVVVVACSGKVQSLGEEKATGGGRANGGSGTSGTTNSNPPTNGGTGQGGYYVSPTEGGGYYLGGQGGTFYESTEGGDSATGGIAATGGAFHSYPGYPPVGGPIDSSCKCADTTQICNVEKECVDRCTPEWICPKWASKHAVRSMYHDGTVLYFAEARSTDVLGNLVEPADASLYAVPTPTAAAPVLVATGLQEPIEILGRYKGSTFLLTLTGASYAIYEVTDTGVVTKLTEASSPVADMQGKWLVSQIGGTKPQFNIFDLEAGRTPTEYISTGAATGMVVVGDRLVYRTGGTDSCSFSLTTPTTPATCDLTAFVDTTSEMLAASTSQLFFGGGTHPYLRAYDTLGTPQLILYNDSTMNRIGTTLFANGWLYSVAYPSSYSVSKLVRYPSTAGALPQEVLPIDWGTSLFAVGYGVLYWAYPMSKANDSHYIFHAPLPPEPL